jgi:hypothetical protein
MTVPLSTISKPELKVRGSDARFRSCIYDFLAFSTRVNQCRAGFGALLGISGTAYTTLSSIAYLQDQEGVGVSRVAVHPPPFGSFRDGRGLQAGEGRPLKKRANESDRRRVLLTVAPKGRKALDGLIAIQAPVNDALFDCLSAGEFLEFSSMMARLVACGDQAVSLLTFLTRSPSALSEALQAKPSRKTRKA